MGFKILNFGSHCSANFQPILECFIPKFKLTYDDVKNIKTDRVNTVVFNLHQIKQLKFFGGHPVYVSNDSINAERKKHDLAIEQLQQVQVEWAKKRQERIDFINK